MIMTLSARSPRSALLSPPASSPPAFPSSPSAQAAEPVTLRYLASQGGISPHELADEARLLQGPRHRAGECGLRRSGGPASLFALASGSVDIGAAATAAVINSIAGGNDFVAAYPSNGINDQVQSVFYVLEDSPIKSIADIAGKTIAVNTLGAHLDYTVREALHQDGLPQNAANLIVVPGPQLEQTLRSGQVDIAGARLLAGDLRRSAEGTMAASAACSTTPTSWAKSPAASSSCAATSLGAPGRRAQLRPAIHPRRRLVAPEPRRGAQGARPRSSTNAARTPTWPSTGAASACAPGAQATARDLDFWIEVLERDGSLPKGK